MARRSRAQPSSAWWRSASASFAYWGGSGEARARYLCRAGVLPRPLRLASADLAVARERADASVSPRAHTRELCRPGQPGRLRHRAPALPRPAPPARGRARHLDVPAHRHREPAVSGIARAGFSRPTRGPRPALRHLRAADHAVAPPLVLSRAARGALPGGARRRLHALASLPAHLPAPGCARARDHRHPDLHLFLERAALCAHLPLDACEAHHPRRHRALRRRAHGALGRDRRGLGRRHAAARGADSPLPAAHRLGTHRRRGEGVACVASISLNRVRKAFPGAPDALKELSLDIADGEFLSLVGPSGCGKSTTLNLIAGLDDPTSGEIRIGGERVNGRSPAQRDIAMVFQSYALYPHKNVRGNLAFPLEIARLPRAEIDRRVAETAEQLGLGELLARKPRGLSGGQRQPVALGRAPGPEA